MAGRARREALHGLRSTAIVFGTALAVAAFACSASASVAPTVAPSPEAIAVPSPTAAAPASPTAQPEPTVQSVPSGETAELISRLGAEAMDFLTVLTRDVSPRASGTDQEKAAADFLRQELEALGYDVHFQDFTVEIMAPDKPLFSLLSPEQAIEALPMTLSGQGRASGALVHVGRAFEDDIPSDGLQGRIALVERGQITFEEKLTRVTDAGAIAAVVYNNAPGLFDGTLMEQGSIPAVTISKEDGEAVLELMEAADVEASVSIVFEMRNSRNVIAEMTGDSDSDVVVVGGHYDTVPNVPGANDNGSGTATVVTLAREAAERDYPFSLRFIGFGSEELGLLGSKHYVDSLDEAQREEIVTMVNLDALGKGTKTAVLGDLALTTKVMDYAEAQGIAAERQFSMPGSSSDYASFRAAGIPVVSFHSDDFSGIHTSGDTLDMVRPELLGSAAVLALAFLDMLAQP